MLKIVTVCYTMWLRCITLGKVLAGIAPPHDFGPTYSRLERWARHFFFFLYLSVGSL